MKRQDERVLEGLSIVVVEDDPLSLEVLCQALEFYGARVAGAGNVADARGVIAQAPPDVVLTDIHLGNDTGVTLLEWLRSRPERALARVPVIAITAYQTQLDDMSPDAFADWLIKPLVMDALRDTIARVATAARRDQRASA